MALKQDFLLNFTYFRKTKQKVFFKLYYFIKLKIENERESKTKNNPMLLHIIKKRRTQKNSILS